METSFLISSDIYYLHNKKSLLEPLKSNVMQIVKKSRDIWRGTLSIIVAQELAPLRR